MGRGGGHQDTTSFSTTQIFGGKTISLSTSTTSSQKLTGDYVTFDDPTSKIVQAEAKADASADDYLAKDLIEKLRVLEAQAKAPITFLPYHPGQRPKFVDIPFRLTTEDTNVDNWCSTNKLQFDLEDDEEFDRDCAWWDFKPEPEDDMPEGEGTNCSGGLQNQFDAAFEEIMGVVPGEDEASVHAIDRDDCRAWKLHPFQMQHPAQMLCDMNVISVVAEPSLSPLIKSLHPEIQSFLRSEMTPLRKTWQKRLRQYAKDLKNYLFFACWGEARHNRYLGGIVIPGSSYRKPARVAGKIITSRFGEPRTAAMLEMQFDDKWGWGGSYGGKKWQQIAKVLRLYVEGEMPDIVFIDRVMNLQHNGGICLNKVSWPCWMEYSDSISLLGMIQPFFGPAHSHSEPVWSLIRAFTTPETHQEIEDWLKLVGQFRGPHDPPFSVLTDRSDAQFERYKGQHIVQVTGGPWGKHMSFQSDWLPNTTAYIKPNQDADAAGVWRSRLGARLRANGLSAETILEAVEILKLTERQVLFNVSFAHQQEAGIGFGAPLDLNDIVIPDNAVLIDGQQFRIDISRHRIVFKTMKKFSLAEAQIFTVLVKTGGGNNHDYHDRRIFLPDQNGLMKEMTTYHPFLTVEQTDPTFNIAKGSQFWEQLTLEAPEGNHDD